MGVLNSQLLLRQGNVAIVLLIHINVLDKTAVVAVVVVSVVVAIAVVVVVKMAAVHRELQNCSCYDCV